MADPLLDTYLEMAGSLIAFTFAANAMVRFRGTHDRISLILAFGFRPGRPDRSRHQHDVLPRHAGHRVHGGNQISLGWLAGRTLLGVLLLAALLWNAGSRSRASPAKEIAGATLIVGVASPISPAFSISCCRNAPKIHPGAIVPRPGICCRRRFTWLATIGYGLRLRRANASLDRALFVAAALNVICHVTMSQSQRMLDAPSTLAHVLMVLSYVVVLGGTLLDNAQLFDQVSHLAASDSLTGLANHRRLLEVLENEIQRSRRTGRSFAVLLFDLDGLKKINDQYGHLTGSRAIKRLGVALARQQPHH